GKCQFCLASWLWDVGQCYYFSAKKSWEQSREDFCSRGAQLVIIRSTANLETNTEVFHVGLKWYSSWCDWKWLNGTALKGPLSPCKVFPIQCSTSSLLACGRVSGLGLAGDLCRETPDWVCKWSAATLQSLQSLNPTFLWGSTTYICVG
ncbi:CL12B protein, partial [Geococcyx californianus]|nr:CL12B protein [Geococcyx californianus]